jgi:hypothetical protein
LFRGVPDVFSNSASNHAARCRDALGFHIRMQLLVFFIGLEFLNLDQSARISCSYPEVCRLSNVWLRRDWLGRVPSIPEQ